MTSVTLNITKTLTVVGVNYAYTTNLANMINVANKYDFVNLNGVAKTDKLEKYLSALLAIGYSLISENYNRVNTIANGVNDFSYTLRKTA